jgi:serine/threonine protein kinase/tetratricopeptide (TPR) repeat protein
MNKATQLEASEREELLFHAAAELRDPAKRAMYLDWACEGSPELRARIEKLLASDSRDDLFRKPLASPAVLSRLPADSLEAVPGVQEQGVGERIGRYKLLQKIGEGGCGVVYMAEQEEPVRRRVALKVVRLGMDTQSVIARFEAERQALALMDHPNIAKILDGGVTESGRPYFVMDLVQGLPIIKFCDEASLPTRERLALFMEVCSAIQHAHQKGIIHRDIKPSNILVTLHGEKPVPKVIDFGIAKATQQRLTDKTVFTQFQQFIGTPAYMSPEQATLSGLDIDTRSDIYSLGVLLYELLTGKTPFESKELLQAGVDKMCRTIREKEPARPSARLSTLGQEELTTTAKRRGLLPPKLISLLRGDLDWIVMKCLEKDRARRYETANGLARDIERHLNNEPVTASSPGRIYRLRKLVFRNRLIFSAAALIFLVLVLGVTASTWQAIRARRAERAQVRLRLEAVAEKNNALTEAARSAQVAQFLRDMLAGVGPSKALGRDTTMLREILDKTVERVGKELTNQPGVQYELLTTLAETYRDLGLYKKMDEAARESLRLARVAFGAEHASIAFALHEVASAERLLGSYEQAEILIREALAMRRKVLGNDHLDVARSLNALGLVLNDRGKLTEAEAAYKEALAILRKRLPPNDLEPGIVLNNMAIVLHKEGKLAEAEATHREVLTMRRKAAGGESLDVAYSLNNLSVVLRDEAKLAEAEQAAREALAIRRKILGKEHPLVANALSNLGLALVDQRKLEEAEAAFREALEIYRNRLGPDHPQVTQSLASLAFALREGNKLAEAETVLREAVALDRKARADGHPHLAGSLCQLASVLAEEARFTDAEALALEALTLQDKALPYDWWTFTARTIVGSSLLDQKKYAEAEPLLLAGYEGMKPPGTKVPAGRWPYLRTALKNLVQLYQATERPAQATEWKKKLDEFEQSPTTNKPTVPAAAKPSP